MSAERIGPTPPPLSGIARKTRAGKGTLRKSSMDAFCDLFRRMSAGEQQTALEVLRQISRIGAPQNKEDEGDNDGR